jgi:single-strand DNA-binding protein
MTAQVTIIGNLTRDPEIRFTPSGDAVTSMRIAVNERIKEGNEWKDGEPSFYEVKAWRKLAEQCAETLRKGQRIVIVGKMKIESYQSKDGETRSSTVVTADEIGESIRFRGNSSPAQASIPRATEAPSAAEEFPPF